MASISTAVRYILMRLYFIISNCGASLMLLCNILCTMHTQSVNAHIRSGLRSGSYTQITNAPNMSGWLVAQFFFFFFPFFNISASFCRLFYTFLFLLFFALSHSTIRYLCGGVVCCCRYMTLCMSVFCIYCCWLFGFLFISLQYFLFFFCFFCISTINNDDARWEMSFFLQRICGTKSLSHRTDKQSKYRKLLIWKMFYMLCSVLFQSLTNCVRVCTLTILSMQEPYRKRRHYNMNNI